MAGGVGGKLNSDFKACAIALVDPGMQASGKLAALNFQVGTAPPLVSGASPSIGANLTARSRIFFALKNVGDSSAVGIPKIATLTPGDVSIYDYLIVGE